jgi:murein DD-endopeptidase MepM/ murein hydrolase activator NlpD
VTASHDRRIRRRLSWRWLRFLLILTVLAPVITAQAPIQPVRADQLSDAVAEQQRLAKLIADQKARLAALAQQQAGLQAQITKTRQNLSALNANLDDLNAQVTSLSAQINSEETTYDGLTSQLNDLELELTRIEGQETEKEQELAQRRAILGDRIVAAYKTYQTPFLEQLLTGQSLTDVVSDVDYYTALGAADRTLADQIVQDQSALAQMHTNVVQTKASTQELADETAARKAQLDTEVAQLAQTQAQLASLQKQMQAQLATQNSQDAQLAQTKAQLAADMRANGQALNDLGKRIDQLIAEQTSKGHIPSKYNGLLKWPMGGIVTQEFGCTGFASEPPLGNCAHFHIGIDLAAPCGTPVVASAPGTVVFVGYNPYDAPPQAWIVIIAHSTGLQTWYAHMSPKAPAGISYGNQVVAGQVVGYEASTGHSTGCHLHWAVRLNGVFSNPRLFV